MKFTMTRGQMKAMLNLAATKDVRYYLCGLHIVQDKRGTIVEATDGHVLGMLRLDTEVQAPSKVILDRDSLKPLLGTKRQSDEVVEFEVSAGDLPTQAKVTARVMGMASTFNAVDGVFPDCSRVTPRYASILATPDEPANFDPDLLAKFVACAKELGMKGHVWLRQRGESQALVSIGVSDFVGVVMPVLGSEKPTIPWWVHYATPEEETAAMAVEQTKTAEA